MKFVFFLLPLIVSFPLSFAQEPSEGWKRLDDMPEVRSLMQLYALASRDMMEINCQNTKGQKLT